jgi:GNAT superfamily N-acetyltransferase
MRLVEAKGYKKEIKKLYRSAFPIEERVPLFFLYLKTKDKNIKLYAIVDNDEFIGLMHTVENDNMVYVFFLAINEKMRGKGYGSKALETIKNMYAGSVVTLAIEDTADLDAENYDERIKRLGFYKKNGFSQLHIRINEIGVVYELLGTSNNVTQAQFLELMKSYFGRFLFKFIYRLTKFEEYS